MTKATFVWDLGDAFTTLLFGGFALYILGALIYFSFQIYVWEPVTKWWRRKA